LIELKLHPIKASVLVANVGEAMAADGSFVDPKTTEFTVSMVEEISALSTVLLTIPK